MDVNFREMDLSLLKKHIGADASTDSNKLSRLPELKAQIKELNLKDTDAFLAQKELYELSEILSEDETIDNFTLGIYNGGDGILVSTNKRLIFMENGFINGLKVEDFPLDKITSIDYVVGMLLGEITVHALGNSATIEAVDNTSTKTFSEFVKNKLSQPKETATVTQPNVLDQLEKLGKLKETGILTEEEFTEQKKKLLAKL